MNPIYASVYSLFEYKPCYFIPKYQRAYAWGEDQVSDFVKDLKSAYQSRFSGRPKEHFFGGVISVMSQYPGTLNVNQYEVIDGQQRLSTFNLLANVILLEYKSVKAQADEQGNSELSAKCDTQINDLIPRFVEFNQLIGEDTKTLKTFRMSKRDDHFYSDLIRGNQSEVEKDSHSRLSHAFEEIKASVTELVGDEGIQSKFTNLTVLEKLLSTDFKILHLVTTNRSAAYQLFQVINDRGVSLTDADLLRCKILELMEGSEEQQNEAERILDEIVSHAKTEEHLSWAFEAKLGQRPKSGALFDEYMDKYLGLKGIEEVDINQLTLLLEEIKILGKNITLIRELVDCEWPFPSQSPIEGWDRDRLAVLIDYLGNTAAIPLLVRAKELGHVKFSEIITMLERFFFRFKVMCNGHNSLLKNIYTRHVKKIGEDGEQYNVSSLRDDLNTLIHSKANDDLFKLSIDELFYSNSNKKKLKHLLSMVSQYARWYEQGAVGTPSCIDKTMIIDRKEGTTLEHIYPKGLCEGDLGYNVTLEDMKHKIGNLCILSTTDNRSVDTDPFSSKRITFSNSNIYITRKVSGYENWEIDQINEYTNYIKDVALKTFVA